MKEDHTSGCSLANMYGEGKGGGKVFVRSCCKGWAYDSVSRLSVAQADKKLGRACFQASRL
eukprot:13375129-Alexandrium_andersonii.AAC.1